MDETIAKEILHELFSAFEALETQSSALLQFVKDKGLATEQELAPYFERAGNASNVRWRAARVRIDHLLASAIETADRDAEAKISKSEEKESSRKSAATVGPAKSTEVNENDSSQKQDAQQKKKPPQRNPPTSLMPGHNQTHTPTNNATRTIESLERKKTRATRQPERMVT